MTFREMGDGYNRTNRSDFFSGIYSNNFALGSTDPNIWGEENFTPFGLPDGDTHNPRHTHHSFEQMVDMWGRPVESALCAFGCECEVPVHLLEVVDDSPPEFDEYEEFDEYDGEDTVQEMNFDDSPFFPEEVDESDATYPFQELDEMPRQISLVRGLRQWPVDRRRGRDPQNGLYVERRHANQTIIG